MEWPNTHAPTYEDTHTHTNKKIQKNVGKKGEGVGKKETKESWGKKRWEKKKKEYKLGKKKKEQKEKGKWMGLVGYRSVD